MRSIHLLATTVSLCGVLSVRGAEPESATPAAPGRAAAKAGGRAGRPVVTDAAKVERDVTYGKAGDVELKLDLYFPKRKDDKPLVPVVYVHGGGWRSGDKATGAGAMAIPELVKRGYLVGSINYRLAPEHKFPAQIEDSKCAIRFLRAHAKEYNLDPSRIGVWGGSAGGHLVALLGTSDAAAGLEGKGGWPDESSRVQAVVDMFGPADLTVNAVGRAEQMAENVFGATPGKSEILKRASPVTHVSKDDPPFLILHGDHDKVVPLSQSEELNKRLKAAGVPSTLVVVKNAGHGFAPDGGEPSPSRAELAKMIGDFFDKHLRQ